MIYRFHKGDIVCLNRERILIRAVTDPDKLKDRELYTVMGRGCSSFGGAYYYLNKGADWVPEQDLLLWRSRREIADIV